LHQINKYFHKNEWYKTQPKRNLSFFLNVIFIRRVRISSHLIFLDLHSCNRSSHKDFDFMLSNSVSHNRYVWWRNDLGFVLQRDDEILTQNATRGIERGSLNWRTFEGFMTRFRNIVISKNDKILMLTRARLGPVC
jgi:hypothetical protein